MTRYALVIGIAEYSTNSFRSLDTPVHNANAIASILDQHGDFNQVKRLPFRRERGQPELGQVIRKALPHDHLVQELQQFLHDADGSDVLIYYSGHGFTKVDALSQTPEGYLAPSDCQLEINANGQVIAQKNGVSLFGLNELIKQHRFSNLVVILDCCNSGAFLESAMVRRDAAVFGYQLDYYLITACRSSSKSYEGEDYSLLTQAILKGLSPENALPLTGRISGDRLFDVIGNEMHNKRQEPIRMGWGRMITLVRYPLQTPSGELSRIEFNPANPYIGLKPFERDQADYFFGRDVAVRALLDRLSEHRFLAVLGSSGSGKSSLVRAGLFPELERDRIPSSQTWIIERITPGQFPLQELARVLDQHRMSDRPLLLFVDQFEELFTLCPDEKDQRRFIKRLDEESSRTDIQTRIIIAMRGDFLDRCAKFQESADLINSTAPTTYVVTPLTEARLVSELEEAITCPAKLHGVSLDHNLTSHIVGDVINQPGAMPLLQYALRELWESSISATGASRQLTLESYQAIGGVKGALQRWADEFYANLSPTDQIFVRDMISELVQIGDDGEVSRRRATWDRLREIAASSQQLERIVGKLIDQRLLVAEDQTVEVAHEALLREARLIQGWIEENRDSIRLQQRLGTYRREWQEHDRSENYLLDAGRIAAIDDWIEKRQPRLTKLDQEFISQSREKRNRLFQSQLEQERQLREAAERRELAEIEKKLEAEARARAEKQGKQFAIMAGILGVFALGFGSLVQLRQSEVKQQQFLTVGALLGKAEQLLETHNELEALDASIEALAKLKEMGSENPAELQRIQKVISDVREQDRITQAHKGGASGLSVSPNGKILVSGGGDGSIRIWYLDNNQVSLPIRKHTDLVRSIKFSSDGKRFATASIDGTVKIWDVQGNVIHTFNYGNYVYDISFSASNQKIAASGLDNGVMIWDIQSKKLVKNITKKDYLTKRDSLKIFSLDFHPTNESILITVAPENQADSVLWDLQQVDLRPKYVGSPQSSATFSVNFSPDGNMFVSCDEDGNINVRKSSGEMIGKIFEPNNSFYYVKFSSDGKFIASAGSDTIIRIWNVNELIRMWSTKKGISTDPIETLQVNTGTIKRISFLKQGLDYDGMNDIALASTDEGGTVRIWQIPQHKLEKKDGNNSSVNLLYRSCANLQRYLSRSSKKTDKLKACQ